MRVARAGAISSVVFTMLALTVNCGSSKSGSGFDTGDNTNGSGNGEGGIGFGHVDGGEAGTVVVDKCHVPPDSASGNAGNCTTPAAPPNSFTPVLKWKWEDPDPGSIGVWTIPLVANFTDDDGNGEVNLCDIPDVIVETAGSGEFSRSGKLYMLSGKDGTVESTFGGTVVDGDATPALADLDGDKVPEVIAVDQPGHIIIFDNKGAVKWTGDIAQASTMEQASCGAIAVFDLDADGTPEIIYGFEVFDNHGKHKWNAPAPTNTEYWCPETTAADLDGDGKLEVIFGNSAYHQDGTVYWTLPGGVAPAAPQIANLDSDPLPEILLAREDGITVLENDGTVKFGPVNAFPADGLSTVCADKAAAIHDFDGDGVADLATSSCSHYGIFTIGATGITQKWDAPVDDTSGIASSTGFDFLGRGIADAVYGDQDSLFVYDGKTGANELTQSRSSGTIIEFPIVADVDNDSSADILVVSNGADSPYPALQVFEDQEKRWIPTRRIWNQHAYSVSNVREDSTIPAVMPKSWQLLNTYRTNAEIENGGTCAPPVPSPR